MYLFEKIKTSNYNNYLVSPFLWIKLEVHTHIIMISFHVKRNIAVFWSVLHLQTIDLHSQSIDDSQAPISLTAIKIFISSSLIHYERLNLHSSLNILLIQHQLSSPLLTLPLPCVSSIDPSSMREPIGIRLIFFSGNPIPADSHSFSAMDEPWIISFSPGSHHRCEVCNLLTNPCT